MKVRDLYSLIAVQVSVVVEIRHYLGLALHLCPGIWRHFWRGTFLQFSLETVVHCCLGTSWQSSRGISSHFWLSMVWHSCLEQEHSQQLSPLYL